MMALQKKFMLKTGVFFIEKEGYDTGRKSNIYDHAAGEGAGV